MYFLTVLEVRSQNWVLWGYNQGVTRKASLLLETVRENTLPRYFQPLEASHLPWFVAPANNLIIPTSAPVNPSPLTLSLLPFPFIYKKHDDYFGSHLRVNVISLLKNLNVITSLKSLLLLKGTHSQVLRLRTGISSGSHFSAHHTAPNLSNNFKPEQGILNNLVLNYLSKL